MYRILATLKDASNIAAPSTSWCASHLLALVINQHRYNNVTHTYEVTGEYPSKHTLAYLAATDQRVVYILVRVPLKEEKKAPKLGSGGGSECVWCVFYVSGVRLLCSVAPDR